MRYPASKKLEIIRVVEHPHLPVKRRLDKFGVPRATFNRWYDRFLTGGANALEDRKPQPRRVGTQPHHMFNRETMIRHINHLSNTFDRNSGKHQPAKLAEAGASLPDRNSLI